MTFTKTCFIRKDTTELRSRLERLGIVKHPSCIESSNNYLYVGRGFYNTLPIGYDEEIKNAIDCNYNEKLFLAIAAIRNDIDIYQWFVTPESIFVFNKQNENISEVSLNWRKATVEELIEYFEED